MVAAALTAAVLVAAAAVAVARPWAPGTTAAAGVSTVAESGVAAGAVPVTEVDAIAGAWRVRSAVPGVSQWGPYRLEVTGFGHFTVVEGCGRESTGYLSLTRSGRISATGQGSPAGPAPETCLPPSEATLVSDGRVVSLEGDVLAVRSRDGEFGARLVRVGDGPEATAVEDLTVVAGTWRHAAMRGYRGSMGTLPLRDRLTIEARAADAATWSDDTGGCLVVGGPLTLDERGYASFLRTESNRDACRRSFGALPGQLSETVGLVLSGTDTLALVDRRGREISRLVRVDPLDG